VLALVLVAPPPASARKPPRCAPGAFRVDPAAVPLLPGGAANAILWNANGVALAGRCPPARPRVRRTRRWTKITATWLACDGVAGKVRARLRIDAATCRSMSGDLRAKRERLRTRFAAQRSEGTVRGRVAVSASAVADVDTATSPTDGDNDGSATAQPIALLATAGGAAYAASRTDFDDDWYAVELTAQPTTFTLTIADPTRSDLDLYLVRREGDRLVDVVPPSRGQGSVEQLVTTTETGPAWVVVFSYVPDAVASDRPWTSYVLSIGQTPAGLPSTAEVVPGEAIVRLKPTAVANARGAGGGAVALDLDAGRATLVAGDPVGAAGLFRLPEPAGAAATQGVSPPLATPSFPAGTRRKTAASMGEAAWARLRTLAAVDELRARPDVAFAEPNLVLRAQRVPADPYYGYQWHYPMIGLESAWDVVTGSPDVVVAIVDTGILYDPSRGIVHPDLDPARVLPGFDFIASAASARDGDGIDPNPFDAGDGRRGAASSFHGSHVAGTIGAASDDGTGVAGVDWHARLLPVRVLGADDGTTYDVAQGIRWAAGLPSDAGTVPVQRADVINLSLGGPGYSAELRTAIQAARAAGSVIVAAAGNDANDAAGYAPASYPEVVTVSAADLRRARAYYSNFGAVVDVAAPGGDVTVDRNGDGYPDGVLSLGADDTGPALSFNFPFYQGTSMAAPHVSGVVALMQAAHLAANGRRFGPDELDVWLHAGELTEPLGPDGWSGNGLIDARKAVARAGAAGGPTAPRLAITPTSVSFDPDLDDLVLQLRNGGAGSLTITDVTVSPGAGWLGAFTSSPLPFTAPGTLTLHAERTGLPPGTVQRASVTIASDAGTVTVPVSLQVTSTGEGGDVGRVFVLLVDPTTRETRYQASTSAAAGYAIDFGGPVLAGEYLLAAGTDRDGDGRIGDPGEAFGIWPDVTGDPQPLVVGEDGVVDVTLPVVESVSVAAGQFPVGRPTARPTFALR
jgi:serine protease